MRTSRIIANALRQTDEHRVADERVANRDFVEMRQPSELDQIVEIEIVAGVDAKTEGVRELRGARIRRKRLARLRSRPSRTRVRTAPYTARHDRRPSPPPIEWRPPADPRRG